MKRAVLSPVFFKDALVPEDDRDPENAMFDLERTLQREVSSVGEVASVDLLPSSLELIAIQDRLPFIPPGKFFSASPTDILRRAVEPHLNEYDIALIDCPPNLGIITLNGLRISDGYVIPTIPDILSTYGIPQILNRIDEYSKVIAKPIKQMGIIVTKYQANSTVHMKTLERLKTSDKYPFVFNTIIRQSNQYAAAAEPTDTSTAKQKWGYRDLTDDLVSLAQEIINQLEK